MFSYGSKKDFLGALVPWWLISILIFTGCATAPQTKINVEDAKTQAFLSQAATQFQALNAPKTLNLADEAEVEWHADKSMRITVHQMWAARVKPDHPLPPIACLNQDTQTLTIQNLQLYDLDATGTFVKSDTKAEIQWAVPEVNLPLTLSKITSARLPELNAGQALELKYTLETKTSTLLLDKDKKDTAKIHPVPAEGSFAFRWNDYTPSLKRDLTVKIPKVLELFATRLREPKSMAITEEKVENDKTLSFTLTDPLPPVPSENFQPALQDLAPLTAFTVNKSWEEAVFPYRKRVKQIMDSDLNKLNSIVEEAEGNTTASIMDRLALVKSAIHQKVDWVDTGLPVYLNPDRSLDEILDSGKGTSHDMAMLLAAALKAMKINCQVYLYRQSTSGDLIPTLPALSQMDGVLVAAQSGKEWIWMDPTESLAVPGVLPLSALGQQALGVLSPLAWKTTPPFGAKDHRKERNVTMEFLPSGRLKCSVDLQAYGSSELALRQFFRMTTDDKRRELVLRGLTKRFPGVTLTDYRFGDFRNLDKPLDVHYTFEVPNYTQGIKGGFEFYPLVFEDVEDFLSALRDSRQTPVVIPQNFNSDTRVLVKLPVGYKVDALPQNGSIANPVAEFFSVFKMEFGTLTYERHLGLKDRTITPGKEYNDLLNFYKIVLNQDRTPFKIIKGK